MESNITCELVTPLRRKLLMFSSKPESFVLSLRFPRLPFGLRTKLFFFSLFNCSLVKGSFLSSAARFGLPHSSITSSTACVRMSCVISWDMHSPLLGRFGHPLVYVHACPFLVFFC